MAKALHIVERGEQGGSEMDWAAYHSHMSYAIDRARAACSDNHLKTEMISLLGIVKEMNVISLKNKTAVQQARKKFEKLLQSRLPSAVEDLAAHEGTKAANLPQEKPVSTEERMLEVQKHPGYFELKQGKLALRDDADKGIGVITKKTISGGKLLHQELPHFSCSVFYKDLCDFCMRPLSTCSDVYTCRLCRASWYCSQACEEEAWTIYHRALCTKHTPSKYFHGERIYSSITLPFTSI